MCELLVISLSFLRWRGPQSMHIISPENNIPFVTIAHHPLQKGIKHVLTILKSYVAIAHNSQIDGSSWWNSWLGWGIKAIIVLVTFNFFNYFYHPLFISFLIFYSINERLLVPLKKCSFIIFFPLRFWMDGWLTIDLCINTFIKEMKLQAVALTIR